MTIRRSTCFLCRRELTPHDVFDGVQVHPELEEHERDCEVIYTDAWGVSIDELPEPTAIDDAIVDTSDSLVQIFPSIDVCLQNFFDERGLPRLGGASSGKGWSSFGLWQRCPYAWKRRYIDGESRRALFSIDPPGRAIGSIVHAHLALYYSQLIGDSPYREILPRMLHEELIKCGKPELVNEGWRVFSAYALYFKMEPPIQPLAIEFDLKDPRTGESCRYDMIAFQPEQVSNRPPGTYIFEHKTAQRFDHDTLDGWTNDGEILGEVMLWKRLGLDKRFGELKGVVVNILGKQKEPKFHREYVSPSSLQLEQHRRDLRQWEGVIKLACANEIFPRSRNNCIGRWGRCDNWDECSLSDESINLMIPDGQ